MSDFYVAVVERNSEGRFFAHIPDLPGVTAAGETESEALSLAAEFANDHVRDLVEDGHPVPAARRYQEVEKDPDVTEFLRAMVPVEVPGKSVKISLSIDEALLARVDRAAEKAGVTRSGYFAAALNQRLKGEITEHSLATGSRLRGPMTAGAIPLVDDVSGHGLEHLATLIQRNISRKGHHFVPLTLAADDEGHLMAGFDIMANKLSEIISESEGKPVATVRGKVPSRLKRSAKTGELLGRKG